VAINYGPKPLALKRESRKPETINLVLGQANKCVLLRM